MDTLQCAILLAKLEFFDDEYVLACTCSLMKSQLGSTSSWGGVGNQSSLSIFITNYGRLYNAQGKLGWYISTNPYATVDLQTENPYPFLSSCGFWEYDHGIWYTKHIFEEFSSKKCFS